LHQHTKAKSENPTVIPDHLRADIGNKIVQSLQAQEILLLAVAVSGTHAHVLAELPVDPAETKRIMGKAKHTASYAVRDEFPGKLWAAGGAYKPVNSREHQQHVFRYILEHAENENARVWSFRDNAVGGKRRIRASRRGDASLGLACFVLFQLVQAGSVDCMF
jgi:REP element-mobilizing transposase RayT